MFEPSHFYPPLITELISELERCEFADSVLFDYHSKTISDPILGKVYSFLNYPEVLNLPSKFVIHLLMKEYTSDFPSIDSDTDSVKLRKFSDNQIDFFADTVDFGLEFPKHGLDFRNFESFYTDDVKATPIKYFNGINAPKTTPRSRNGLKVLSWKVKDIVERLGNSSYQEVADCLVKELDENDSDIKDEKNIRRRVYDALNVLIAVGMLKKVNKRVEPLKKIVKNVSEKAKHLRDLTEKFLTLKGLIERNKNLKKGFQNLFLPVDIVVIPKKSEKPAKILANLQKTSVNIKVDQKFQIFHSDEILKKIDVECDLTWVPTELNSLCKFINYDKEFL